MIIEFFSSELRLCFGSSCYGCDSNDMFASIRTGPQYSGAITEFGCVSVFITVPGNIGDFRSNHAGTINQNTDALLPYLFEWRKTPHENRDLNMTMCQLSPSRHKRQLTSALLLLHLDLQRA